MLSVSLNKAFPFLSFIYLTERLIDYLDSLDGSDWAERNKTLMRRLVNELTEKLPEENVVSFSISWKPEGKQSICACWCCALCFPLVTEPASMTVS